jgi:hypothetical protein
MSRIKKMRELTPSERRLLARAYFLQWVIWLGLWLFPFARLQHFIEDRARKYPDRAKSDQYTPEQSARLLQAASRGVPCATCLVRALALHSILLEGNHPSQLRFGVRKSQKGQLEAHAWVECEGTILLGTDEFHSYQNLN